jgi:hypothetical protein
VASRDLIQLIERLGEADFPDLRGNRGNFLQAQECIPIITGGEGVAPDYMEVNGEKFKYETRFSCNR